MGNSNRSTSKNKRLWDSIPDTKTPTRTDCHWTKPSISKMDNLSKNDDETDEKIDIFNSFPFDLIEYDENILNIHHLKRLSKKSQYFVFGFIRNCQSIIKST
eukprot:380194_1